MRGLSGVSKLYHSQAGRAGITADDCDFARISIGRAGSIIPMGDIRRGWTTSRRSGLRWTSALLWEGILTISGHPKIPPQAEIPAVSKCRCPLPPFRGGSSRMAVDGRNLSFRVVLSIIPKEEWEEQGRAVGTAMLRMSRGFKVRHKADVRSVVAPELVRCYVRSLVWIWLALQY